MLMPTPLLMRPSTCWTFPIMKRTPSSLASMLCATLVMAPSSKNQRSTKNAASSSQRKHHVILCRCDSWSSNSTPCYPMPCWPSDFPSELRKSSRLLLALPSLIFTVNTTTQAAWPLSTWVTLIPSSPSNVSLIPLAACTIQRHLVVTLCLATSRPATASKP